MLCRKPFKDIRLMNNFWKTTRKSFTVHTLVSKPTCWHNLQHATNSFYCKAVLPKNYVIKREFSKKPTFMDCFKTEDKNPNDEKKPKEDKDKKKLNKSKKAKSEPLFLACFTSDGAKDKCGNGNGEKYKENKTPKKQPPNNNSHNAKKKSAQIEKKGSGELHREPSSFECFMTYNADEQPFPKSPKSADPKKPVDMKNEAQNNLETRKEKKETQIQPKEQPDKKKEGTCADQKKPVDTKIEAQHNQETRKEKKETQIQPKEQPDKKKEGTCADPKKPVDTKIEAQNNLKTRKEKKETQIQPKEQPDKKKEGTCGDASKVKLKEEKKEPQIQQKEQPDKKKEGTCGDASKVKLKEEKKEPKKQQKEQPDKKKEGTCGDATKVKLKEEKKEPQIQQKEQPAKKRERTGSDAGINVKIKQPFQEAPSSEVNVNKLHREPSSFECFMTYHADEQPFPKSPKSADPKKLVDTKNEAQNKLETRKEKKETQIQPKEQPDKKKEGTCEDTGTNVKIKEARVVRNCNLTQKEQPDKKKEGTCGDAGSNVKIKEERVVRNCNLTQKEQPDKKKEGTCGDASKVKLKEEKKEPQIQQKEQPDKKKEGTCGDANKVKWKELVSKEKKEPQKQQKEQPDKKKEGTSGDASKVKRKELVSKGKKEPQIQQKEQPDKKKECTPGDASKVKRKEEKKEPQIQQKEQPDKKKECTPGDASKVKRKEEKKEPQIQQKEQPDKKKEVTSGDTSKVKRKEEKKETQVQQKEQPAKKRERTGSDAGINVKIKQPYKLHHFQEAPSSEVNVNKEEALLYYKQMQVIRRIENASDALYKEKIIRGFCHLYSGQEACAVGIKAAMRSQDNIITAYRCHGWCYMMGISPVAILAELTGRRSGCQRGKGGSMHMYSPHFFGGNGIVGGHVPLGAGIAFSCKYKADKGVCFAIYGDGAANQGQVFESFNIAYLWKLPCIFVCENNQYGMGTAIKRAAANTNYYARGDVLPGIWVDGMDVLAVRNATEFAIDYAIKNGPMVMETNTYRYGGHSMSDPGISYRTREEVQEVRQNRDPITNFKNLCVQQGLITEEETKAIDEIVRKEIDEAVEKAKTDPEVGLNELTADISANNLEPNIRGVLGLTLPHTQINKDGSNRK